MQGIHVFLNGDRGVALVGALVAAGHGVAEGIVEPERLTPEMNEAFTGLGVPLRQQRDVNEEDFVRSLAERSPRLLVVAGFNRIFRPPLLRVAREGSINLHPGRLPEYRGGSSLNWQMINGEATAHASVIQMDEGVDTGDVLGSEVIEIGPQDTIADLHAKANAVFPHVVLDVIEAMERGTLAPQPQDESRAVYWHQRRDQDGHIRWRDLTAVQAHNMIRALTRPYPGAFTFLEGRRLRIFASSIPRITIRGVAGRVCYVLGDGPFVVCRDGAILVEEWEVDGGMVDRLLHGAILE